MTVGYGKKFGKAGSKKASTSRKAPRRRPIRRTQVINPFGVGAINDFRNDEALMCAGLDRWFPDSELADKALIINEERLEARLGCSYFVKPPDFGEADGTSKVKIPHVRFPLWHYCPRCFRMDQTTIFGGQPHCDGCSGKTGSNRLLKKSLVPVA